ncbi:MAG: hypothetical protein BroJett030_28440 [Alphaproteobacteria bacterium]|nr:MAG: hypothetical protein BroJett030_28440 [Alphaproteobacteria bacterium]
MKVHTVHFEPHAEPGLGATLAQLQARVAGRLRLGLFSRSMRYGLSRDLAKPIETPSAKIPIEVRPMVDADLDLLLDADTAEGDSREKTELAWRRAFVNKGARGGFVAVDLRDGRPCYMQWLFGAADNDLVQRLGSFPLLAPHEALLENAYTPLRYRGLGIMSAAMARIAERAADFGASQVLTFVDDDNIASLKGCQRAGFFPHMAHYRVFIGFGIVKLNRFEVFAGDDPRRAIRF